MEKWRSKGRPKNDGCVLPPTKRTSSRDSSTKDKKKERKWSFGGLLRRISSGQRDESSSNEEDITYIPGHMLAKKHNKRVSKMRSKLGKASRGETEGENVAIEEINYRSESTFVTAANVRSRSPDTNDLVNSPSSDGSLDAPGRHSRISATKARAEAKRVRLCGDSSSDDNDEVNDGEVEDDDEDNSHRSSQSSMKFRHEQDVATQRNVQRTDSWSRRTRGARTERYIKRMSRDDCINGAIDDRVRKGTNASCRTTNYEQSTNQTDFNVGREINSPTGCEHVRSRDFVDGEQNRRANIDESLYESRALDGKRDTQERDKFTWPKTNLRRTKPGDDVYGSLKAGQWTAYEQAIRERKVLPPEPPPRSSKSRIFSNITKPTFVRYAVEEQPVCRGYCETTRRDEAERSCMSDNDIIHDYRAFGLSPTSFPNEQSYPRANTSHNSLDRTYGKNNESSSSRMKRENHENATSSFVKQNARITRSLPKGVELFSRQEVANRPAKDYKLSDSSRCRIDEKSNGQPIPRPRTTRNENNNRSNETKKIRDENEAERKRSSRNLQEALFELETIYNSLRLSDPDLLDRAEERTMNEYRDNAAKNLTVRSLLSNADVSSSNDDHDFLSVDRTRTDTNLRIEDDMAYRRMNPKERPSSVNGQSSLSCISYLATSPNLSIRDNERIIRPRSGRSSPDLTRDDLLFRSISHAMNTLKVIEPQPPFGIPLGPVTGSNESDYLHVKPSTTKHGQTRSLYIPKSEPDVVSDDLAFRNLRKDNTTPTNKNTCYYMQMDASIEPRTTTKYDTSSLGGVTRKKHAVRSNTTDLNGSKMLNNDWYNEYLRTSQKLSFTPDESNDTLNNSNATNDATASSYKTTGRTHDHRNGDLDINGNRSKFGLQRKIQVYVPREYSSCDNEKYIADNGVKCHNDKSNDDSRKLIIAEFEDSEDFCDSQNSSALDVVQRDNENDANIERFTEQEISEYAQLCRDLEKLLRQTTANDETKKEGELVDIEAEKLENDSQSEFDEWERLFNEDYEISSSTLNFNEDSAIPCNERDDDRSSSRSAGLSSENLPSLARKRIDKFGDDDLLSSASDVGACSNNGSLPDSVYEKFDRLLREVNDLPLVECTNKINEHATTIASNSGNNVSGVESKASPRVTEVDWESRKTKGEIRGTLNDTSRLLENPTIVASPKNPSVDRPKTNNLENLKSLTRRMRNEEIAREARVTTSQTHEYEERTKNKDAINDEKHFLKGTNARPRSLDLSDESSIQRDEFEKLVHDALSSSPPIDLSICSDNESSTDSVYDKFNQLLREVNDFPVVECVGKIHENVGSKLVEDDDEETNDAAKEPVSRRSRINVSSLMRHPEDSRENLEGTDNLKRRYGINVDTNNETHDTMLEGKTRLEVRTDVPNEALISREDQLTACYHGDLQRGTCFTLATITALPVDINI